MLNGKENKTVRVWSEKQFRGKESFVFGSLVFRWWVETRGGSCGFPCSAGHVDADFVPVITIVVDEVGDFAESLVCYDVR